MKTLPLILAAGHLCLNLGLASAAQAAIPETKHAPKHVSMPLKPAPKDWAKDLAHPISRHTLCQTEGRQAFSARTCSILTQLAPAPTEGGQVIEIRALKANRTVWLSLPLSVRDRLESYDLVVIATKTTPSRPELAR